jgi:hypothetical protein
MELRASPGEPGRIDGFSLAMFHADRVGDDEGAFAYRRYGVSDE